LASQLDIPPPIYTDSLIENLERIYEHPRAAIQVPRLMDLVVYDYIIPRIELQRESLQMMFADDVVLIAKMAKNVITFLENAIGFPRKIMEPLFSM
jgi:hypothetical protein